MVDRVDSFGRKELRLVRIALFLTAILLIPALIQFRDSLDSAGYLDLSQKWRLGIDLLFGIGGMAWVLAFLSLTRLGSFFLNAVQAAGSVFKRLGILNNLIFTGSVLLFPYLCIYQYAQLTPGFFTRAFILWTLTLIGFGCLSAIWSRRAWPFWGLTSLLLTSAAFRITFFFTGVNNYPLTLYWSETSNYFYSSLFLANKIYGFSAPLPLFNPARALLGIFPFLIPDPQIWINRLWASLLWIVCTGLVAYLAARRLSLASRLSTLLLAGWAFFFMLQGPIYYELLLSVALVLGLFDLRRRFWRSLLVVGLASIWAGLCRLNWYPMPGMVAALLYFLEVPRGLRQSWLVYFFKPALWAAAGTVIAIATFAVYTALSGNPTSTTATALQSPLLWYRLFPSGTNAEGVLPNAIIVALPALTLIGLWFVKQSPQWDAWRKVGIFAILAASFAGGIVVSVKIGGGSNIHNLDAFWFLLLIVSIFLFFSRSPADRSSGFETLSVPALRVPALLTIALVVLPILLPLTFSLPDTLPDKQVVDHVLNDINAYVAGARNKGQEVLLIDNKQLITFGFIPSTRMVTEYETVYMLEMAMTGSQAYFDKFQQDLKNKRFGVIIANPQPTQLQDPGHGFAEENNAQIQWVGQPLLCYYQNLKTWLDIGISVLVPEPVPCK